MKKNRIHTLLAVAVSSFALTGALRAGTLYWDTNLDTTGSGNAGGSWDTGTNWTADSTGLTTPTVGWTDGEDAVIAAGTDGTGAYTITLTGTIATPSILVEEAGAKTITGGTITLGGGVLSTVGAGNGNTFTVSSTLAGAGGLTVAGNGDLSDTGGGAAGMLVLSGANTFTGDMTITAGLVRLNSGFGDAGNKIILNGGGIIDPNLNVTTTRNIEIGASGGTVRLWGGATTNLNGSISNFSGVLSTTLKHTDGGTLRLGGSGAGFTGTFNNARGNVEITAANANWANTDFLLNGSGGTLTFNGTGTATAKSINTTSKDTILNNGTVLDVPAYTWSTSSGGCWIKSTAGTEGKLTSSTGTLTFTNGSLASGTLETDDNQIYVAIQDAGATPVAVVKNNNNALGFNRASTYTGGTTINGGRISVGNVSALGTGAVTVSNGGQAYLTVGGTYANSFDLNGLGVAEGGGTLGAIRFQGNTVSGGINVVTASRITAYSSTGTHSGALTGSAALEIGVAGNAGTMNFTGNTSGYLGTMTLAGGTLNVGASGLGGSLVVNTSTTANLTGGVAGDLTNNGTTTLGSAATVSGNATVSDGATIKGEGTVTGTLNLGVTAGANLRVDAATTSTALTAGTLNLAGTNTVAFDTLPSVSGEFVVLKYTTLNSGNETNFSVPLGVYRGNPQVVHDDINSQFVLTLDAQTRTWDNGATTGIWNTTDLNWVEDDGLFYAGDSVEFGNTAAGTVTMTAGLQPLAISFTNTSGNNYTMTGGSIIGTTGITKTGDGNVTMGGTNTFSGAVAVNAGLLTIGSQQALGQNSGITIAAGARVDLNGQSPGALGAGYGYTWTIAGDGGDGANGVGAITNTSGTATYGSSGVKSLVLSGNAEIGGNAGRFDVGSHAGAGTSGTVDGGGYTLTKVGSNQMVFRAPATDVTFVVNAGTLNFEDFDTSSGIQPITVNNTAVMGTYGPRTLPNNVTLNTGTTLSNLGGGNGTWTGEVTLAGNATFSVGGGNIIIDGSLAGTGNITRTGGNFLILQNTGAGYSGKIVNNGGTLRVESASATGTYAGADAITMADGTTLQGGTITALASATVGSATQGITHSGTTGTVFYDSGAGNTLTIAGAVAGGTTNLATQNGTVAFSNSVTLNDPANTNANLMVRNNSKASFLSGANVSTRQINLGVNDQGTSSNMDIAAGATASTTRLATGDGGSVSSVITHSGGTLNITGNNNSGTSASFLMGHWGGGTSNYNLSGGTLNSTGAMLSLGWDTVGANFNVSGGTANLLGINLDNGRNNAAAVNLTGGRINLGGNGITNASNKAVNLGGGTVGAFADWSSAKNITLTGTGGNVSFDTLDSVDLTTPRIITLSGVLSGTGGLVKKGAGTLALTNAAGTFTGTASSEGGTLLVGSGSAAAATVKSVAGGSVQPGLVASAGTANVANLTLDGGTAAFRVGTSSDKFNVTGTLTVDQPTVISALPANAITSLPATFTVIDYTGTIGGPIGFDDLSFVPANPHLSGELVHNEVDTQINVQINTADTITWTGADDGVWDVGTVSGSTLNWRLDSDDVTESEYYDFDVVTLDEVGIGQPNITLTGTITPASVSVANITGTYTLSGSGIGGTGGLTKSSTGDLTLLNNNTYAGTTTITGGTVTVGNGGTIGALGGAGNITLSGATLAFNRSDAQTLGRTIVGTGGTLIKNGAATLTMNAGNNTCDITINNGVLAARGGGWATSFAANRTITVNTGGTLDTTTHALGGLGGATRPANIVINEDAIWKLNNEQQLPNTAVTMTAGIINGPGDVRGAGTIATVAHATKSSQVNCPVNTGNGAVTFNVADGAVATDLSVTGNISGGNAVTKIGAGTMVLTGTNNTYAGGTNANGGVLEVSSVADAGGAGSIGVYTTGAAGYLGVANDATFRYTGAGAQTTARNLWIDTGVQPKTIEVSSPTGDLTFSGTAGNINKPFIKAGAGALTIADAIVPGAAVTVNGGKLTLGGTNSYTSDTVVNIGGTLVVDGDAIADAGRLDINGTGKVEVTEPVDPTAETVDTLWIDGVQMAAGTYGATGSGATTVDDTHFLGAGVINVTTGPVVPSGYATWASTNAPTGTATDDFDGDGVPNGVEYVLGGDKDTNDLGKLPVAASDGTNMTFTFVRDQDSIGLDTSVEIEVGTDLVNWPASYTVGADTAGSDAGVTVTDNLDGTDTITLTVTMAPDAVKFGRLHVVITTP